jgi:LCP family protein required for cell wall assembly
MLASLDRSLGTISLVSIPRDIVDAPLGDGRTFAPKLNSLYSYADRHPKDFPKGGLRTLEDAVGALLGVRVHAYAEMDFTAFVRAVDLAGGVDVHVAQAIEDPVYDGYGFAKGSRGFTLTTGDHHLDGVTALAYARSRYGVGGSDFLRAARQQEILVALKSKLTRSGSLFFQLPELLDIFGDTVRTDLPPSLLPQLAAVADGVGGNGIVRVVIQKPLVHGERRSPYGSVQVPDLAKIRAMAAAVLPDPGTAATSWPPSSKPSPKASASP